MRTIKFRGKWIAYQNRWVYGSLILVNNQPYINHATCVVRIDGSSIVTSASEVYASTVGQFTGLKDRNGNEIYEGDIVDFGLNAVVKYHPFLGSFVLDCDNREPHFNDSYSELGFMEKTSKKFVIIGNIHDNPELLKGGAK